MDQNHEGIGKGSFKRLWVEWVDLNKKGLSFSGDQRKEILANIL